MRCELQFGDEHEHDASRGDAVRGDEQREHGGERRGDACDAAARELSRLRDACDVCESSCEHRESFAVRPEPS